MKVNYEEYGAFGYMRKVSVYKKEILELYRAGMSQGRIAEKLNISRTITYKHAPKDYYVRNQIRRMFYLGLTKEDIKKEMGYEYNSRIDEAIRLDNPEDITAIIRDYRHGVPHCELDHRGLTPSNFHRVLHHCRQAFEYYVQVECIDCIEKIVELHDSGVNNASYISKRLGIPSHIVYTVLKDLGKFSLVSHNVEDKVV